MWNRFWTFEFYFVLLSKVENNPRCRDSGFQELDLWITPTIGSFVFVKPVYRDFRAFAGYFVECTWDPRIFIRNFWNPKAVAAVERAVLLHQDQNYMRFCYRSNMMSTSIIWITSKTIIESHYTFNYGYIRFWIWYKTRQ